MDLLTGMLHYDAWANRQVLAAALEDEKVLRLLGHLAQAKHIWLLRLEGQDTATMDLWPQRPLDFWRQSLPQTDRRWIERIGGETPQRVVEYRNQTGQTYQTPLREIALHVVNHGTYHRGQLATAVKNAGGTPAVTDFIAWSRAGRPPFSKGDA
jgi:uncharacterized damage-inducible protein DinB